MPYDRLFEHSPERALSGGATPSSSSSGSYVDTKEKLPTFEHTLAKRPSLKQVTQGAWRGRGQRVIMGSRSSRRRGNSQGKSRTSTEPALPIPSSCTASNARFQCWPIRREQQHVQRLFERPVAKQPKLCSSEQKSNRQKSSSQQVKNSKMITQHEVKHRRKADLSSRRGQHQLQQWPQNPKQQCSMRGESLLVMPKGSQVPAPEESSPAPSCSLIGSECSSSLRPKSRKQQMSPLQFTPAQAQRNICGKSGIIPRQEPPPKPFRKHNYGVHHESLQHIGLPFPSSRPEPADESTELFCRHKPRNDYSHSDERHNPNPEGVPRGITIE